MLLLCKILGKKASINILRHSFLHHKYKNLPFEKTHLEILKRSYSIFEFMSIESLLTEKHILSLWENGQNQLRTHRETIFNILVKLCDFKLLLKFSLQYLHGNICTRFL